MQYRLRAESLAKPLDDLDQRCRLFNNLPIAPTHEEWLRQRAWIRTIHGTTRIEGNTLSAIEVEALLAGGGAALLGGVAILIWGRDDPDGPAISLGPGTVTLSGSF